MLSLTIIGTQHQIVMNARNAAEIVVRIVDTV